MKSPSDSQFYLEKGVDGFSNLNVDVNHIYETFPIQEMGSLPPNELDSHEKLLRALYATPLLPLRTRLYLWRMAFRSHMDLEWFKSFTYYWTRILGARPLWSPHDFYYLKNVFRSRFQNITLPDTEDSTVHLGAWQRPELVYQLMHLITKDTALVDAWIVKRVQKLLSRSGNLRSLEFGCGTAPITLSATRFWGRRGENHYYIADIDTLAFHYSSYYFRGNNNVTPLQLKSNNNFRLELQDTLDAIFCIQVLEHLNQPLATIQRFTNLLRPGGVLVFDFIKTEGEGLDTIQAVRERDQVINFIQQNYRFESTAAVDPSKTIDMTFAVKT